MKLEYTRVLQMTTGKLFAGREDTFGGPRGLYNDDSTKSKTVCMGLL